MRRLILAVIVLFGLFLRLHHLADLPYPPNGDEKAIAYYAWSVFHFGTDEYGNRLPLYFPSIGDYKYPGYSYLSAPIIGLLGLNNFTARLPSALAGTLLIVLLYQLSINLFHRPSLALITSLLTAISPWSLTFSHTASESNLCLLLTTAGLVLLTFKTPKYFLSFIFFCLAFFTYPSSRVFIPAFLFLFSLTNLITHSASGRRLFVFFIAITFVSAISLIPWQSRARAQSLSILNNSVSRQYWIDESARLLGMTPTPTHPTIVRTFFNKPNSVIFEIVDRYLQHFSPKYLFLSGDVVPQNSTPNTGQLYLLDLVFLILGIIILASKPSPVNLFPLLLIIASPLPAIASVETPSAVRQLIGLSGFVLTISVGIDRLCQLFKPNAIPSFILYSYFFLFMFVNFFNIKPYRQPWTSDQGGQEMVESVWQLKDQYSNIVVRNTPYIDFLFYRHLSPSEFTSHSNTIPEKDQQWARVKSFYNIYFGMDVNCPKIGKENTLYVCRGVEIPRAARLIKLIRFSDTIPSYSLVEFVATPEAEQAKIPLPSGLKYMVEGDGRYPLGILTDTDRLY